VLRLGDKESDCWVEGDDGGGDGEVRHLWFEAGNRQGARHGSKRCQFRESSKGASLPEAKSCELCWGSCARLFVADGQDQSTCHKWLAVVVFTDGYNQGG